MEKVSTGAAHAAPGLSMSSKLVRHRDRITNTALFVAPGRIFPFRVIRVFRGCNYL
jgi:hypothetical protein